MMMSNLSVILLCDEGLLQQTDNDKYKFSHWRYDVGHKSFVPPVPGDEHIVRDANPASLYPG